MSTADTAEGDDLRAPFPWFGGKRRVADLIWSEFGDVANYVEPFAGSLAVLLGRPRWHLGTTETVNDKDAYVANFWRSLAADPAAVAEAADWPVSEIDLSARHLWLVNSGMDRLARMVTDPDHYDAKVAGWWVWGLCSWIGSGWCSGNGPHLGDSGRGVNRKLPHLGDSGQGVNRQLPHLGSGRGVAISRYLVGLASRLRGVRVCCGDWSRVVTDGALSHGETVGVFLDPPYLGSVRTEHLYSTDDHDIAHDVRRWAIEHGDDQRLRIALCGYEEEHAAEMPATWRLHRYSATRAYGSGGGGGGGGNAANRHKEAIWFSPGCIGTTQQLRLFGDAP